MMYIVIDHDQCKHANAYSDVCLAKTMRHPLGHENYCMAELRDDGSRAITFVLREGGEEYIRVFESEEVLRAGALEGAAAFSFDGQVETEQQSSTSR